MVYFYRLYGRLIYNMGMNIKNPETHRLAQELAELTGESMATAVAEAVRERLARQRRKRSCPEADGNRARLLSQNEHEDQKNRPRRTAPRRARAPEVIVD